MRRNVYKLLAREKNMANKPITILKMKGEIYKGMEMGIFDVEDKVLINPDFKKAPQDEVFAFEVVEGSDFKITDVKPIKNDPEKFMTIFLGEPDVKSE